MSQLQSELALANAEISRLRELALRGQASGPELAELAKVKATNEQLRQKLHQLQRTLLEGKWQVRQRSINNAV